MKRKYVLKTGRDCNGSFQAESRGDCKLRKDAAAPELIIGADTVVAKDGVILGKPKDEEDAYRMLSMLQGDSHKVYTGVTFILRKEAKVQVHSFLKRPKS